MYFFIANVDQKQKIVFNALQKTRYKSVSQNFSCGVPLNARACVRDKNFLSSLTFKIDFKECARELNFGMSSSSPWYVVSKKKSFSDLLLTSAFFVKI